MRKIFVVLILFFAGIGHACPELQGHYACERKIDGKVPVKATYTLEVRKLTPNSFSMFEDSATDPIIVLADDIKRDVVADGFYSSNLSRCDAAKTKLLVDFNLIGEYSQSLSAAYELLKSGNIAIEIVSNHFNEGELSSSTMNVDCIKQ